MRRCVGVHASNFISRNRTAPRLQRRCRCSTAAHFIVSCRLRVRLVCSHRRWSRVLPVWACRSRWPATSQRWHRGGLLHLLLWERAGHPSFVDLTAWLWQCTAHLACPTLSAGHASLPAHPLFRPCRRDALAEALREAVPQLPHLESLRT